MLTAAEQQLVLHHVKRMLAQDRQRQTKLRTGTVTPRTAAEGEQREMSRLHDLLKELG